MRLSGRPQRGAVQPAEEHSPEIPIARAKRVHRVQHWRCLEIYLIFLNLFFSDAQARLNGRRMHCRSIQTSEHLAWVFGIGTLFVLCNPGAEKII